MSSSVIQYPLNYIGAIFKDKLLNISDPANPTTVDLTNNNGLYILFFKSDGIQTPTQLEIDTNPNDNLSVPLIVRAIPETPGDLTNSNIIVSNVTSPSLLTQRGKWEYAVAARFTDGRFLIQEKRKLFWVT